MKKCIILSFIFLAPMLSFAQKGKPTATYSAKGKYSAKMKKALLTYQEPFVEPTVKPNFYTDCSEDVKKFCYPLRSSDSTAPSCLQTEFLFGRAMVSEKCFPALKFTLKKISDYSKLPPMVYSETEKYSVEQRIGLMQWPNFKIPKLKPNYAVECREDEARLCPKEIPASTDAGICVKEKFFQGAQISNSCFPAFKFYNRWIEDTASDYPECVQDYNKYCRTASTGIQISDCMMKNIDKINSKCAATIKSLRKQTLEEKKKKQSKGKTGQK